MQIKGVSNATTGLSPKKVETEDTQTKSIRKQIANVQKQLKLLGEQKDMDPKEMQQKKQELQQEIADLNNQLRQHQIELKKQKEEEKKEAAEKMNADNSPKQQDTVEISGLSKQGMQGIIQAGNHIKAAKENAKLVSKLKGRKGVLEIEIKIDGERGGTTKRNLEELAQVTSKIRSVSGKEMSELTKANKKAVHTQKEEVEEVKKKEKVKKEKIIDKEEKKEEEDISLKDQIKSKEARKQQKKTKSIDVRI